MGFWAPPPFSPSSHWQVPLLPAVCPGHGHLCPFPSHTRQVAHSWHLLAFVPELARRDGSLEATQFLLVAPWWPGEVFVFLFIVYTLAGSWQILLLD